MSAAPETERIRRLIERRRIAGALPVLRGRRLRRLEAELAGGGIPGVTGRSLEEGFGWERPFPPRLLTMIGRRRLENVRRCVEDVLSRRVPGDLIEAGVWRGGAAILMRAVLAAHGVRDRSVVAADSFQGVPPPRPTAYPADAGMDLHRDPELAATVDEVRANFSGFDLLDDQVEFVEGLFRDTLPSLAARRWAVVRLDGDLYESTMDGLRYLYPSLSPGGFLIVDDYGAYPACATAVDDYRRDHAVTEPITHIDWTGVYWRKDAGG